MPNPALHQTRPHELVLGLLRSLIAAGPVGLGKVAQPLRVAVTGTAVSPPIDVTLELLGRTRTFERIDAALSRSAPGAA